jgi:nitronate monooxygenase
MTLLKSLRGHLPLPVIGSPLFIISVPDLVVAQCCAGIIGSMPSLNARPAGQLNRQLAEIRERLAAHDARQPESPAAPFAINLIVHRSNDRLRQDLALCVEHRVPIVITSLGARPEVNDAVHFSGGVVLHDVINQRFAHSAVEKGADRLILVAAGAGGHAGTLSPFALVQNPGLVRRPHRPVGRHCQWAVDPRSPGHGRGLRLHRQRLHRHGRGAGGGRLQAYDRSQRRDDIVYSDLFTGVHGNYFKDSIAGAGLDPENLASSDAPAWTSPRSGRRHGRTSGAQDRESVR